MILHGNAVEAHTSWENDVSIDLLRGYIHWIGNGDK